jgi:hypothetical protein
MQNNVYDRTPNKLKKLGFFQYNAFVFGLGCKFGQVYEKSIAYFIVSKCLVMGFN